MFSKYVIAGRSTSHEINTSALTFRSGSERCCRTLKDDHFVAYWQGQHQLTNIKQPSKVHTRWLHVPFPFFKLTFSRIIVWSFVNCLNSCPFYVCTMIAIMRVTTPLIRSWKLITRRKSLRAGRKIPAFQSFRFPNTLSRLSNIAVHPINQDNQNKRVRFDFFLSQLLRRASDMTSSLLRKYFFHTGKNNIRNVIVQKVQYF